MPRPVTASIGIIAFAREDGFFSHSDEYENLVEPADKLLYAEIEVGEIQFQNINKPLLNPKIHQIPLQSQKWPMRMA